MAEYQTPRGVQDFYPPRSEDYERTIRAHEDLFKTFGYRRIDTPPFEHTELFERGLDVASDIVNKEMYVFPDRKGRSLTLRPDGTTPVMRAVIEHGLTSQGGIAKLYYTAEIFRYERPQAGRYRVHTQTGVEAIGSPGPEIDAEVIELASAVYDLHGLTPALYVNSIGHPECRQAYRPQLVAYLEKHREEMCGDCQRKIEANPLRTFDCKVPTDVEIMSRAPLMLDHLCGDCDDHFKRLKALLSAVGLQFDIDPRLVRGLDYYTRTTFVFRQQGMAAQNEIGGGGRYDGLAEMLGGKDLPGIGFGLGVERIMLARGEAEEVDPLDVFFVVLADQAVGKAFELLSQARRKGLRSDMDHLRRGAKAQLRSADRSGAKHVVILGEREIEASAVTLKVMQTGEERLVPFGGLVDELVNGGKD